MTQITWKRIVLAAMSLVVSAALVGCEQKGPMENAGKDVDNAGKNLKDAVSPPKGPLENAGNKVDRAVDGR